VVKTKPKKGRKWGDSEPLRRDQRKGERVQTSMRSEKAKKIAQWEKRSTGKEECTKSKRKKCCGKKRKKPQNTGQTKLKTEVLAGERHTIFTKRVRERRTRKF